MNIVSKYLFPFLLLSVSSLGYSDSSKVESTRYVYEDVDELIDKYSQTHSTANEYWQLTQEEWQRYETLLKDSPWAKWHHTATPLAILSHYATSLDEKRRYARIEAELDQWRQHSTVLFQTLYDQERAIVSAKYKASISSRLPVIENVQPQDHLQLYVEGKQCNAECRTVVSQVLSTGARVDIFVTNAPTNEDIFLWAESASIPVDRVKVKQVTLNRGTGVAEVLKNSGIEMPELPVLLKRTGAGIQEIPL